MRTLKKNAKLPRVAIVGRANVGKSTLFNKLTGGALEKWQLPAIVSPEAGTTRDRKEYDCTWRGLRFTLIDTGGLDLRSRDEFQTKITAAAQTAIGDAQLLLFVVDTKTGTMPADLDIARMLRALKKPVILAANKADKKGDILTSSTLYTLGFGKPWPVSAISGIGSGDLLDEIVKSVGKKIEAADPAISVAIIGKPNVGKSTLQNALAGSDRAIVDSQPFTTRDANGFTLLFENRILYIIDTAGIRRRSKINPDDVELKSSHQSLDLMRTADVVVLAVEAFRAVTAQDRHLAGLAAASRASVILAGMKWDIVGRSERDITVEYAERYHRDFNELYWAPVVLVSGLEKKRLTELKRAIIAAYDEQFRHITDNALNKFLKWALKRQRPLGSEHGKSPRIFRIKQVGVQPPQFVIEIDKNAPMRYSYLNFLERQLRDKFGFAGSPIKMWVEKR